MPWHTYGLYWNLGFINELFIHFLYIYVIFTSLMYPNKFIFEI